MDRSDEKPTTGLPDVPPEWVPLIDLPSVIARRFGVSEAIVAVDLAEDVWTGSLRPAHRIAGAKPDRNKDWPCGLDEIWPSPSRRHSGRHWEDDATAFGERVIAIDWDDAKADRRNCTVAGRKLKGGTTERLAIEMHWPTARAWAASRLKLWDMKAVIEADAAKATPHTPEIAPPRAGAARGGAPPTYDWAAFSRELTRAAMVDGFTTRTEMAAYMRKYVQNNWEKQPDDETLRRRLKEWFYYHDLPE